MKLFIKNMVSARCKIVVTETLAQLGFHKVTVNLGEVEMEEQITAGQYQLINANLSAYGLELLENRKSRLIEKIKHVIIHIVFYTNEPLQENFSNYLSRQLNYDYTYMANIFSETEGQTIEKYFISLKIEKVKALIIYDNLNLTEIAWKLNYSSVAHLSNQFKKVTGITPTLYKRQKITPGITMQDAYAV